MLPRGAASTEDVNGIEADSGPPELARRTGQTDAGGNAGHQLFRNAIGFRDESADAIGSVGSSGSDQVGRMSGARASPSMVTRPSMCPFAGMLIVKPSIPVVSSFAHCSAISSPVPISMLARRAAAI